MGFTETGLHACVIPNRISYWFNFHGPSIAVTTSCSSSLHAIHLACQALAQGECSMALAGGVHLILDPASMTAACQMGILSTTGSIRPFDRSANGTLLGEGGGLVALKPMSRALGDGNRIAGLIKGTAVNHGGRSHSITFPNVKAQAAAILRACEAAGITASQVSYVEAHGSGTVKGDAAEAETLAHVFGASPAEAASRASRRCGVGSVKANVGHLASAAGIASVIKVLLSLRTVRSCPHLAATQLAGQHRGANAGRGSSGAMRRGTRASTRTVSPSREWPASAASASPARTRTSFSPRRRVRSRRMPSRGGLARTQSCSRRRARPLCGAGPSSCWPPSTRRASRNRISLRWRERWIGREPMEHRLGFVAETLGEVRDHLERAVRRLQAPDDERGAPPAVDVRSNAQLSAQLNAWIAGADVAVDALSPDRSLPLLMLPTYPFEKERYWASPKATVILDGCRS